MLERCVQFNVISVEELRECLAEHVVDAKQCFAQINVFGSKVVTRSFKFPPASQQDFISGLKFEAAESFLLTPNEIELTYHILQHDQDGVSGFYVAMPKKEVLAYLECFKKSNLIPIALCAAVFSQAMDVIYQQEKLPIDFCVVSFFKDHTVSVAGFFDGRPALFREISDVYALDLVDRIKETILYASRYSTAEKVDRIFFTGQMSGKEDLLKQISLLEHSQENTHHEEQQKAIKALVVPNLLENYVLSYQQRNFFLKVLMIGAISFFSLMLLLGGYVVLSKTRLEKIESSFSIQEYQRALDLKELIRRMNHVK